MATAYRAPIDAPDALSAAMSERGFDNATYDRINDEYIERLRAIAKENGSSDLLGEVIRFQRGDGYAMFMVWKTRPLELVHLEIGDAWDVEEALIRGLRLSDIKEMVESDRALRELFGSKEKV